MCERHRLDSLVRGLWARSAEDSADLPVPEQGREMAIPRPKPPRRRKLWELESKYLCPVVGTCLALEEIKRIARRDGFLGSDFDDYRLHVEAVSVSGNRNSTSEALHRTLECKHQRVVKDFDRARNDVAVAEMWRHCLARGEVAGALWAVMTHKAAGPETRAQAYADVHMLSHQVGAGQAADSRRLTFLEGEVERLRGEACQDAERAARELTARASRIRALEAERQRQSLDQRELSELRRRLAELESGQAMVAMGRRLLVLEAANGELREQAGRVPGAEARLREAREELDRLRDERDALSFERDALERLLLAEAPSHADCAGECASCPENLRDRCVLCVGGRTTLLPQYRQLAARLGVRLIHHDGGREEAMSRLPELLSASDAVICPTDCVSHPAYYQVKKHCKQAGKPCVLTRNSGLAGFAAALERLAEGRVEIRPLAGREG